MVRAPVPADYQETRSRGVGKVLLDAAEGWARGRGCADISVRSNSKRARTASTKGTDTTGPRHIPQESLTDHLPHRRARRMVAQDIRSDARQERIAT